MDPRTPANGSELEAKHAGIAWVIAAVFLQMLPATLVAPAIRPLFAQLHDGVEGPMHAFMSLNMLGGILATPLIARWLRSPRPERWLRGLALADCALLFAVAAPIPTALALGLRTLEGAAHIGASTMLLARAAAFKPVIGAGRAMGLAGGAVMMAVALGSGFGGLLVALRPEAPFWVGAGLALLTAFAAPLVYSAKLAAEPGAAAPSRTRSPEIARADVLGPLTAAFVERCTVGMIIVSFALFATRVHGITDRGVGILYSLLTLPFALLMYPASRLGDRIPRASLLGAGALLYGTALASLAVAPAAWLSVSMLAAGIASALMYGSVLCYAATLVDAADRPRMMAWINMTGAFGMMVGPAIGGVLATWARVDGDPGAGYRLVFMAAGALSVVWAMLVSPWLVRRYRVEASKGMDVGLQAT